MVQNGCYSRTTRVVYTIIQLGLPLMYLLVVYWRVHHSIGALKEKDRQPKEKMGN